MTTQTPWGIAQRSVQIAPGIMDYSTTRHGGIHLSHERNQAVPDYMRNPEGWYEEDCAWSIPALVFKEDFANYFDKADWTTAEDMRQTTLTTFRNWYPEQYIRYTGKALNPGESRIYDQQQFDKDHFKDWVAISATTDDSPGMVRVTARIKATSNYGIFLASKEEYNARSHCGFVVDPIRHKRVD